MRGVGGAGLEDRRMDGGGLRRRSCPPALFEGSLSDRVQVPGLHPHDGARVQQAAAMASPSQRGPVD
eukprot:1398596-Rhodomonas_salina.1